MSLFRYLRGEHLFVGFFSKHTRCCYPTTCIGQSWNIYFQWQNTSELHVSAFFDRQRALASHPMAFSMNSSWRCIGDRKVQSTNCFFQKLREEKRKMVAHRLETISFSFFRFVKRKKNSIEQVWMMYVFSAVNVCRWCSCATSLNSKNVGEFSTVLHDANTITHANHFGRLRLLHLYLLTFNGVTVCVICNPMLRASTMGPISVLYNRCKPWMPSIIGTFFRSCFVSYAHRWFRSSNLEPLYVAVASVSVNAFTSPKPRFNPIPASGCTRCAASLFFFSKKLMITQSRRRSHKWERNGFITQLVQRHGAHRCGHGQNLMGKRRVNYGRDCSI